MLSAAVVQEAFIPHDYSISFDILVSLPTFGPLLISVLLVYLQVTCLTTVADASMLLLSPSFIPRILITFFLLQRIRPF
jgi:hypothetical protein